MAFVQGYPRFKAILSDGSPAVGYKLQSYLAGTTTPEPTYTDQTESAQNPQPMILDGNGEAAIWLKPLVAYKLVLKTDADVVVWTLDAINTREGAYFSTLNISGLATMATITASGQITSTVATGTAPLVIASTTKVANLNADLLDGKQWDAPDPIGAVTPSTGKFTTLQATGLTTLDGVAGETLQGAALPTDGSNVYRAAVSEEITLSTSGTTTDSVANLLPANSVIDGVVARITQAITVATDWKLGDATTLGRFLAAQSGSQLNLNATAVGLAHRQPDVVAAAGPVQTTAAKLRITTTGTPAAGKIRVTVFFTQFVAPVII